MFSVNLLNNVYRNLVNLCHNWESLLSLELLLTPRRIIYRVKQLKLETTIFHDLEQYFYCRFIQLFTCFTCLTMKCIGAIKQICKIPSSILI